MLEKYFLVSLCLCVCVRYYCMFVTDGTLLTKSEARCAVFFFVFITSKAEIILNFRDNNLKKKHTGKKKQRDHFEGPIFKA